MDQELALEIMMSGYNVLLTGPPGSGKTYVLNEFIREARAEGKSVAVTATTGLAATHLNGTTLHAWSGIGILDHLPPNFQNNLAKGRRETIIKTDVLVVDEVSMLHDFRLDMVEELTRSIRGGDKPFGGLQVILCGDFFQLPPVNRSSRGMSDFPEERRGGFVVGSAAWQLLNPVVCYLSEQHRHEDQVLEEILSAMRASDLRRRHVEQLLSRQNGMLEDGQQNITELYVTNVDVDRINRAQLKKIDVDEHIFEMTTTGRASYVDSLKRSCLAAETLLLKVGAFVMCLKNNLEKKYSNGSLGIIESFDENSGYPIVRLHTGHVVEVEPETWELRDGDKKRASLTQLPLRLAWAITVHKSQGMTLDAARIDLAKAFVEGMGYVALSRVRSLDTLSLVGLNRLALKVSDEALSIDSDLNSRSGAAAKRFEHLRLNAAKRKEAAAKKAASKSKSKSDPEKSAKWQVKLANMRKDYPNAFMPWKDGDDEKLGKMFKDGKSLKVMTNTLGRHPGSITARLKKNFGEDVEFPL